MPRVGRAPLCAAPTSTCSSFLHGNGHPRVAWKVFREAASRQHVLRRLPLTSCLLANSERANLEESRGVDVRFLASTSLPSLCPRVCKWQCLLFRSWGERRRSASGAFFESSDPRGRRTFSNLAAVASAQLYTRQFEQAFQPRRLRRVKVRLTSCALTRPGCSEAVN